MTHNVPGVSEVLTGESARGLLTYMVTLSPLAITKHLLGLRRSAARHEAGNARVVLNRFAVVRVIEDFMVSSSLYSTNEGMI